MRTSAVIGKEKIKRSHVAFPPPICVFFVIAKIFGFDLSLASLCPPLLSPSLCLSSFILCIFGIERSGEKEKRSAAVAAAARGRGDNAKEKSTREEEIALV